MEQLTVDANVIGQWAIVAFFGGKIEGTGYGGGNVVVTPTPVGEDPYYYVRTDPNISDTLIVAADPLNSYIPDPCGGDPGACEVDVNNLCNHYGYDCTCIARPIVDPRVRIPTFDPDQCPAYEYFGEDVPAFNALAVSLGYELGGSWDPVPMGNWGYHIVLDQPDLWDPSYHPSDEWKYGLRIRDNTIGALNDWCPRAGVIEYTVEG